jgi:hypothetical protein
MDNAEVGRWDKLFCSTLERVPTIYSTEIVYPLLPELFSEEANRLFLDSNEVVGKRVLALSVVKFNLASLLSPFCDYTHILMSRLATVLARGVFNQQEYGPNFLHAIDDRKQLRDAEGVVDAIFMRGFMFHQGQRRFVSVVDFVSRMLRLGGKAVFDFLGSNTDAPADMDADYGVDWRIFRYPQQYIESTFASSPLRMIEQTEAGNPPRSYVVVEKV